MHKCVELENEISAIIDKTLDEFQKKFEPLAIEYLEFLKKFDNKNFIVLYDACSKDDVIDIVNKFFVILGTEDCCEIDTLKYILFESGPIAIELDAGNDIEKEIIKKTIKYIGMIQKKLDNNMRDSFKRIIEINNKLDMLGCEN